MNPSDNSLKRIIRGRRVVYNGRVGEAILVVENGVVIDILPYNTYLTNTELLLDCTENLLIMAGLVRFDNIESIESFDEKILSMPKQGVTTLINILNDSPNLLNIDKVNELTNNKSIDIGLIVGADTNIYRNRIFNGSVLGMFDSTANNQDISLLTSDSSNKEANHLKNRVVNIEKLLLTSELQESKGIQDESLVALSESASNIPSALVGINDIKGTIAIGRDADFVVWNPENGVVEKTILRGQIIYNRESSHTLPSHGQRIIPTFIQTSKSFPNIKLPAVQRLNTLDDNCFLNVVNLLFETAPPLARGMLAARPYLNYEQLIQTAIEVVAKCTPDERVELLNSHPKIGAKPTEVSTLSYKEQGYDKQPMSDEAKVLERLALLNVAYQEKYGFTFMVFVNGRSKAEIIPILEKRLNHSTKAQELQTGISEFFDIASSRLAKLKIVV
ncbi:allantoinase [Heterostelium album PN500]|uniref:Allantoinase n=1 Tax=Heterostelium pallidum (strain ATCC 26659 / Pp 5 / PN500) TaxID=670386 RepID=D3B996_HETP5|nr:allantoinase [Heterostelium album PN500]EFA82135.1 allantoinase [Heterostelium album PN500]|eukprot:XP_020434252.1 allantoinase [Heterostelium album PN500]